MNESIDFRSFCLFTDLFFPTIKSLLYCLTLNLNCFEYQKSVKSSTLNNKITLWKRIYLPSMVLTFLLNIIPKLITYV